MIRVYEGGGYYDEHNDVIFDSSVGVNYSKKASLDAYSPEDLENYLKLKKKNVINDLSGVDDHHIERYLRKANLKNLKGKFKFKNWKWKW